MKKGRLRAAVCFYGNCGCARERIPAPLRQRPDHSVGRSQCVAVKQVSNTWYVSIHLPHQEKTGHYSRRSHAFTCEADARKFAARKIAEGVEVSAGTINPVVPKRIVGPAEIKQWLSDDVN
jgi:hypothetical protein